MNRGHWILPSCAEGHAEGHIQSAQPASLSLSRSSYLVGTHRYNSCPSLAWAPRGVVRGGEDVLGIRQVWKAVPRRLESRYVELPSSLRSLCVPTASMVYTHTSRELSSVLPHFHRSLPHDLKACHVAKLNNPKVTGALMVLLGKAPNSPQVFRTNWPDL